MCLDIEECVEHECIGSMNKNVTPQQIFKKRIKIILTIVKYVTKLTKKHTKTYKTCKNKRQTRAKITQKLQKDTQQLVKKL